MRDGKTVWDVPPRAGVLGAGLVLMLFGGLIAAPLPRTQAGEPGPVPQSSPQFHIDGVGNVLSPPSDGDMKGSGCAACHRPEPGFSHPVGVVPSMEVPAHLPLENGRLSCITCHEADDAAHLQSEQRGTAVLREGAAGPGTLCVSCHDAAEPSRAAQHGSGFRIAHLRWQGKLPDRTSHAPDAEILGSGVDPQSRTCLSCHDGLMGSDIALSASAGGFDPTAMDDHPVGVLYDRPGGARSRDGMSFALRPLSSLDARIDLFEGRVSCNSCHSPYSERPSLLVMSNERSGLCLSCHAE